MKWVPQDIEQYIKAQEFIDTAVIPLIPVAIGQDMKQSASMSEFTTLLTSFLERQFTGRILLLPPFTYFTKDLKKQLSDLEIWISALKSNQFTHIFLLTCDSEWKIYEENLNESLIWVPTISLENLENSQKLPIIEDQVKQILTFFTRKWHDYE